MILGHGPVCKAADLFDDMALGGVQEVSVHPQHGICGKKGRSLVSVKKRMIARYSRCDRGGCLEDRHFAPGIGQQVMWPSQSRLKPVVVSDPRHAAKGCNRNTMDLQYDSLFWKPDKRSSLNFGLDWRWLRLFFPAAHFASSLKAWAYRVSAISTP